MGKDVAIESGLYTVIGVIDKRKQPFGSGKNPEDNVAYFPMGTFHNLHPEDKDLWVSVKYDDPKNKAAGAGRDSRAAAHPPQGTRGQAGRFRDLRARFADRLWNQLTGGLFIFMVAVSCVGLMVGGVGVMNIMLVSVTERTREIGVRKAIGATRRTFLAQFTMEAVTLCAVGGVLGIVTGAVLTLILHFAVPFLARRRFRLTWVCLPASASRASSVCSSVFIRRGRPRIWIRLRRCGTSEVVQFKFLVRSSQCSHPNHCILIVRNARGVNLRNCEL